MLHLLQLAPVSPAVYLNYLSQKTTEYKQIYDRIFCSFSPDYVLRPSLLN